MNATATIARTAHTARRAAAQAETPSGVTRCIGWLFVFAVLSSGAVAGQQWAADTCPAITVSTTASATTLDACNALAAAGALS